MVTVHGTTDTLVYAGLDLTSANKSLTSHADHADNPTSYADINFSAMSKDPATESAGEKIRCLI